MPIAIRQCQGSVLPSMFQEASLTANELTSLSVMDMHFSLHGSRCRSGRCRMPWQGATEGAVVYAPGNLTRLSSSLELPISTTSWGLLRP